LWTDLERLRKTDIRLINFVTEPIVTREIIARFFPGKVVGANPAPEAHYDVRTLYSNRFDAEAPYLMQAEEVMADLAEFVKAT